MARLIAGAVAGTLIVMLALTAGLSAFTLATGCATAGASLTAGDFAPANPASGSWDADQVNNARTILTVGERLGVPPRGQVVALATALQESGLRNLPYGDADSLGIFQQRPSAGWGTPAQILDPAHAATRFYQVLAAVPDWQAMSLTQAAQTVQRSAYPLADDEAAATGLYVALSGGRSTGSGPRSTALGETGCSTAGGDGLSADADVELPAGFTLPATTPPAAANAVAWALAQRGTPYSYGGDCTAAHSADPIRQCDCSTLVISSSAGGRGDDLGVCVLDAVVDGPRCLPGVVSAGRDCCRVVIGLARDLDLLGRSRAVVLVAMTLLPEGVVGWSASRHR